MFAEARINDAFPFVWRFPWRENSGSAPYSMYTTTDRFTSSCALGSDTVSSVLGGLCLGNGFSLRKLLIDVKAYFLVHHVEQKRSEGI